MSVSSGQYRYCLQQTSYQWALGQGTCFRANNNKYEVKQVALYSVVLCKRKSE